MAEGKALNPRKITESEKDLIAQRIKEAIDTGKKDINVVLAGKSGVGKSTLFRKLLGDSDCIEVSPESITQEVEIKECTKNGITIHLIDTPGLEEKEKISKRKQLENTAKQIHREIDLLLYCIPVSPGSKFNDGNPTIMQCLQKAYTPQIWKRCVVIFTFSNLVWDRLSRGADSEKKYIDYIKSYSDKFREALREITPEVIEVVTVFDTDPEVTPNPNTILAIPAGDLPEDQVLPRVLLHDEGWIGEIFFEMLRKTTNDSKLALLQFQYGPSMAEKVFITAFLGVHGGGFMANTIAAGIEIGTIAGPGGAIVGGIVGAIAGYIITTPHRNILKDLYKDEDD